MFTLLNRVHILHNKFVPYTTPLSTVASANNYMNYIIISRQPEYFVPNTTTTQQNCLSPLHWFFSRLFANMLHTRLRINNPKPNAQPLQNGMSDLLHALVVTTLKQPTPIARLSPIHRTTLYHAQSAPLLPLKPVFYLK